ncbi:MAG: GGDEF domain-containing protein [Clostridia bacterium]|nr:GGDEF domain-containing protein [Clostridia bacterium]
MLEKIFTNLQIELITILLCIYLLVKLHHRKNYSEKIRRCYIWGITLMVLTVVNFFAQFPDLGLGFKTVLGGHILNTFYMLSSSIATFAWFDYTETVLDSGLLATTRKRIMWLIPLILFSLLCFTNYWTGIIFDIGPNGEYIRGNVAVHFFFGYFYVAISLLRTVYCYARKKSLDKYGKGVILTSIVFIVGMILQLFFYHNYIIVAYILGLFATYVETCSEEETLFREKKMQSLTDRITEQAGLGIWEVILAPGKPAQMIPNSMMAELLEVKGLRMAYEDVYQHWRSRIKAEELEKVNEYSLKMQRGEKAEIIYEWNSPTRGIRIVRCGGVGVRKEDGTIVLHGYHYDVTSQILQEREQQNLLREAYRESERQKEELRTVIQNYREADYDRRIDFLTGLYNRLDLFELLTEVLSGKREKIKSMYMMDIDNFKALNDQYGHTYGDRCLQEIGGALLKYGKQNNLYFYRYGGEELLGVCFDEEKEASEIATELVNLVYSLNIPRDDSIYKRVTVSVGYTTNNCRYEKMIDKADIAMYKAKELGKNRAFSYEDL